MKLKEYIARIPQAKLVAMIGGDVVNALQECGFGKKQQELTDILLAQCGTSVFRISGLLDVLKYTFSEDDILHFWKRAEMKGECDVDEFRDSFFSRGWNDEIFAQYVLDFFELQNDAYLHGQEVLESPMEIIVPRLSAECTEHEGLPILIPEMFPLHPYQKEIKDRIVNKLLQDGARFLVHMPTGSGKTKTAVESLLDYWRAKGQQQGFIVWLVHSKELCEQAYQTFKDTWRAKGDAPIPMYRVFEGYEPDLSQESQGVVFASFQKFHSLINRGHRIAVHLKDDARLVVVDEAHKSLAKTYNEAIDYLMSPNTSLMGLTATPGRSTNLLDDENLMLSHLYAGNAIAVCDDNGAELDDPIAYLQSEGYLATLKREKIEIESDLSSLSEKGKSGSGEDEVSKRMLDEISNDSLRNQLIVQAIKAKVDDGNLPVLVFATSISHAVILKVLLGLKEVHAECIFGSTPSDLRVKYIEMFKKNELPVLINYQVLTAGFDAPNLRTLVIARPTSSIVLYSQMLGRALRGVRMGGSASENTVIDVVDNYSSLGTAQGAFNYFSGYFSSE